MEVSAMEEALPNPNQRRKGGLRTIPFIILFIYLMGILILFPAANEIFEKVASFGLTANMILYLTERYLMSSALATVVLYNWNAFSNFLPIFGAVLADAYLGRFRVIALGSFVSLSGMCLLCLTAILPVYKKTAACAASLGGCEVVPWQMPLLFTSFALMSIGSGGIRPCTLAFGADQLDKRDNSAKNVRTLQTFFNWYYTVLGLSIVFAATVIVYIQQARGWVVGFVVPVVLMVTALTLFLLGSPFYLRAMADRSAILGLVQVLVATYKNRHEPLPQETSDPSCFYNKAGSKPRTPTNKLRNPAKELNAEGAACDPWRLCTVQMVEDTKAVIRVLPIWSTGILPGVIVGQQMFPTLQAKTMDRKVGHLEIPAATFGVFSILTLTVWVAVYDRALVRPLSRLTGHARGLSLRQRMGFGLALFAVAMAVAARTESVRRAAAVAEGLRDADPRTGPPVHMSAMRLVPQHCLTGLAEGLNLIGQIEFYYSEFPKTMSSIGVSLLALGLGFGALLGSAIVAIIGTATRGSGDGWLPNNLNRGHYDDYYLVLAVLGAANVVYFVACAWAYGEEGQNRVAAAADDAVVEEDGKEEEEHKAVIM
nr:unnamed protein product [Digitaria exilis]